MATKRKDGGMIQDRGEGVPREPGAGMGNRSGVMTAPERAMDVIREAQRTPPDPRGDARRLAEYRKPDIREGAPIGSLPEPAPDARDAEASRRLFDKLGERLAFERQGVRLYESLIGKVKALGKAAGGPTVADLEHILDEERGHFRFLQQAIARAGGDPTAQTPSADIAGVLGMGAVQVVGDPRTTVAQCLQAMLQAELADNDGWDLLRRLAASQGESELEAEIGQAIGNEAEHLEKVRAWITGLVVGEAGATAKPGVPPARTGKAAGGKAVARIPRRTSKTKR